MQVCVLESPFITPAKQEWLQNTSVLFDSHQRKRRKFWSLHELFFFFKWGTSEEKKKGEPLLEQQTLSGTLWESLQFPRWPAGAAVDCEVQHGRHLEETPISALGW